ncbi:hypothetical protein [Bacillus benzoevorans]|uniref:Uncharacterized protein n=1 Tax=Bacillus benzoevorans TaxID=1456 RepID=A0A7X0HPH3_9BACI|nr:hypothetical protein [Bacillus benzoevorans]MBB6444438.1 hypothetical protein [Bacillus benzoevorans]
MYHYRYAQFGRQRQPYHHQISAPPFHLQAQMPHFNQINSLESPSDWNGLGSPSSWNDQINPEGLWNPGGLAGFGSPGHPFNGTMPVNQKGLGNFGQMMGWGGLGGPAGWESYGNPMGWGNNMGQGLPGMFGGLFKVGKGALGGLGMLSNLISLGKFFY